MTESADIERTAAVRALYEAKVRAELAEADQLLPGADRVAWSGAVLADVVVVKGLDGPAEASGGEALSGADGEALAKALHALGWPQGVSFHTVSRPIPGCDEGAVVRRLRLQIEAVDPALLIALDAQAADDVARAFGVKRPKFGEALTVNGRRFVAVDGFEDSLVDESHKRRVWKHLQAARPDGPVF